MGFGRNERGRDWRDARGPRSSFDDDRGGRFGGDREERGFFERAGDEVASWFGDDDAERRRAMDDHYYNSRSDTDRRPGYFSDDDGRFDRGARQRDEGFRRPYTGRFANRPEMSAPDSDNYRPMTGDYSRSSGKYERDRFAGRATSASPPHDRHYDEWRRQQIDALDRDYDDYRRENQSKFDSDFSNWRSVRQSKRQMLGSIREHMQVVGSDEQALGTVDKVRGDRIILTKDDSSDGKHHSVNCAMIDRVEGDRVILDKNADDARALFGNEDRDRALFERDDNRQPGAHILDRSFSGTY